MMLRIVAVLRLSSKRAEITREDTGSPVSMYVRTMSAKIWRFRRSWRAARVMTALYSTSYCRNAVKEPSTQVGRGVREQQSTGLLRVVDLRALQLIGVVDVQRLPLGVEVDGGDGCLAMAIAGLLGAAKGQMRLGPNGRRIDINDAGEQIARRAEGAIHVARINRCGKAIGHAISHIDGFVEAADGDHRYDRPKNLLLRDAHFGAAV